MKAAASKFKGTTAVKIAMVVNCSSEVLGKAAESTVRAVAAMAEEAEIQQAARVADIVVEAIGIVEEAADTALVVIGTVEVVIGTAMEVTGTAMEVTGTVEVVIGIVEVVTETVEEVTRTAMEVID